MRFKIGIKRFHKQPITSQKMPTQISQHLSKYFKHSSLSPIIDAAMHAIEIFGINSFC